MLSIKVSLPLRCQVISEIDNYLPTYDFKTETFPYLSLLGSYLWKQISICTCEILGVLRVHLKLKAGGVLHHTLTQSIPIMAVLTEHPEVSRMLPSFGAVFQCPQIIPATGPNLRNWC